MNTPKSSITQPVYAVMDFNALQSFFLKIADLTIEVACDCSIDNLGVQGAKEKFIVPECDPVVRINAFVRELPEHVTGQKIFDAGQVWQLYQRNGHSIFSFKSSAFGDKPNNIAIFNQDFSNGDVYFAPGSFRPGQIVDPLGGPLDELLYGNLLQGEGESRFTLAA